MGGSWKNLCPAPAVLTIDGIGTRRTPGKDSTKLSIRTSRLLMDIIGDRKFVEVPGGKTHELPPLLVKTVPEVKRFDRMMTVANEIIEQEDMVPCTSGDRVLDEESLDRRK